MTGEETKSWRFHHLGVIVGDMEKAVEYYQSLGFVDVLPATPRPANPPTMNDCRDYFRIHTSRSLHRFGSGKPDFLN